MQQHKRANHLQNPVTIDCNNAIQNKASENLSSNGKHTFHAREITLYFSNTIITLEKKKFNVHRFIPESPRWLLTKGRAKEAKELLQKASRENGVEIADSDLEHMLNESNNDSTPDTNKPSIFDLFRYPNLRKKSVILFFNW